MASLDHELQQILAQLPPDLQQEVAAYARDLLSRSRSETADGRRPRFYICPICFAASAVRLECHGHRMIGCNARSPEECRPPATPEGALKVRAPQWFVLSVAPGKAR